MEHCLKMGGESIIFKKFEIVFYNVYPIELPFSVYAQFSKNLVVSILETVSIIFLNNAPL